MSEITFERGVKKYCCDDINMTPNKKIILKKNRAENDIRENCIASNFMEKRQKQSRYTKYVQKLSFSTELQLEILILKPILPSTKPTSCKNDENYFY